MKMQWFDKLETKLGRFAVRNLMFYIIIGQLIVFVAGLFNTSIYSYLILDPAMVRQGQVWRLISFLLVPPFYSFTQVFWLIISFYFYYFIGKMLDLYWGSFRFNLYYLIGVVGTVAVAMIFDVPVSSSFLNETLFFAFATLFPDMEFLIFFILPVKAKWLALLSAGLILFQFVSGTWGVRLAILIGVLNYLLFFGATIFRLIRDGRRRMQFQQKSAPQGGFKHVTPGGGKIVNQAFHRCCICGKTELDDPNMQFRYCAQCDGNREYCMDHLYQHEHYKETPAE